MANIDDEIIEAMQTYGGSFVQALAACYRRADAINQQKLKTAFPEYFVEYAELAGMLKARRRDAARG